MKKNTFFNILIICCLTHCSLFAQWVKTNCPLNPEALCVNKNFLFAGSEGGVVKSSDDGNTWKFVNKGLHSDIMPAEVLSFYSFDTYLFAYVPNIGGGEFFSDNDGENWSFLSNNGLTISADQNGYLFSHYVNGSGVLRSSDSGKSWIPIDSGFSHYYSGIDSRKLLFRPPVHLDGILFTENLLGEIYRSTNNGDFWDSISTISIRSNVTLSLFASDSALFTIISGIILRSLDQGYTWDTVKSDFGTKTMVAVGNKIFAGGYYGIILSTDNGKTWKVENNNVPDSVVIDAFEIKDGYLFAGAYYVTPNSPGGLWRRPLADFTNKVKDSIQLIAHFFIYPNPAKSEMHITYSIPKRSDVVLSVFDITGKEITTIASEAHDVGSYENLWNVKSLPNGSYILKLTACGESVTKVVEVVK